MLVLLESWCGWKGPNAVVEGECQKGKHSEEEQVDIDCDSKRQDKWHSTYLGLNWKFES